MRVKRISIVFLVLLVLVVEALTPSLPTLRTHAQDNAESPIEQIDTSLTSLNDYGSFDGAILIAKDGEILLNKGYGYANRDWEIPNSPQTKFRIGSITKHFTATAILKLQEDGALSVDDPICDYFDACPDTWQDITIHHLLNHTSGLTGLGDIAEFKGNAVPRNLTGRTGRFRH